MKPSSGDAQHSVQFSRTQGVLQATALGGSLVLGIAIFVAGPQIVAQSGALAPLVFLVGALLYIPLILSCVQRGSGAISNAGFYSAARKSGSAFRLFFTVWMMLGGYLALGALLAYGAAIRLNVGLERVLGFDAGIEVTLFAIVAAIFAKEILAKGDAWRSRTVVFWICVIFLCALIVWGIAAHYRAGGKIPKAPPLQHWLIAVSMLASTLWSIDIILNYRGQLRNPNRTAAWSLVTILCGAYLLGGLIAELALRQPSLLMQNWLAILTWKESRLELLILITGILLCGAGLLRVMTRITRLLGAMITDGALPSPHENLRAQSRMPNYYAALFSALLVYCALKFSATYLLLISGFGVLLSMVLYLHPMLKNAVSRDTHFFLPLHPTIPILSMAISIFLMAILPLEDLFIAGLWLFAGAILFFVHSRKKMLPSLRQEDLLTPVGIEVSKTGYRVLVCLGSEEVNASLVRIGSSLAMANNGATLVLRVLETSEVLPADLQRNQGLAEWERIRTELLKLSFQDLTPTPVVRLAPDLISGIRATAREFAPDFLLVEWPEEPVERTQKNQLQNLLQLSPKPLGILKGQLSRGPRKVSVACGSSAHTVLALQIGHAICSESKSTMSALRIFARSDSEHAAEAAIQSVIAQAEIHIAPEIVLQEESDVEAGILRQAADSDLLVLGASDDPLSGRLLPDGQSMEIARQRERASLIVKGNEETSRFFARRLLSEATKRVSPLTPKERAELLSQLKVGLQARADFYLMVALAASIAITGLIMNDGSVVLGAMLVSPLMSPIVGIACGIALGNLDLIRRSGASTFKGMGLVLVVGVVMTFLLPRVEPTDQILSRTHPGIFDLLAALAAGAAGAYSLGRKTVAGALPGVAMSLSLEPPLATAGYGLSTSQFWIVGGALLLFLTNLAAIVLSGVAIYLLLGMRPTRKERLTVVNKAAVIVILVILILVVPLGLGTLGAVRKGHMKFQLESQFRQEAVRERFELLDVKITEQGNGFLVHPTVLAFEEVTPGKIENLRKALEAQTGYPILLEATVLQTRRYESPHSKDKNNGQQNETTEKTPPQ